MKYMVAVRIVFSRFDTYKNRCTVMNAETIREYALAKADVEESFPFGPDTLVFKTNEKVFLLMPLDASPLKLNVKCHPDKATELRETYPGAVLPGFHMNKKHWNMIVIDGILNANLIRSFIDDSYDLVRKKKK